MMLIILCLAIITGRVFHRLFFRVSLLIVLSFITVDTYCQNKLVEEGRVLFERTCVSCHGKDGAKGAFGAKNLQRSTLSDQEYMLIIQEGKRVMPAWKKKYSSEEINLLIKYIKTFRIL